MTQILEKGAQGPDFTLHVTPDQTLSLNEFAGAGWRQSASAANLA
ncbi:hypothetical protein [Hansschlegelia sp.]|nr:hypothetical protein [Hansschlegelia sp.]HVI28639.1 hypothetical protein [Hansschlegelia sp.]